MLSWYQSEICIHVSDLKDNLKRREVQTVCSKAEGPMSKARCHAEGTVVLSSALQMTGLQKVSPRRDSNWFC